MLLAGLLVALGAGAGLTAYGLNVNSGRKDCGEYCDHGDNRPGPGPWVQIVGVSVATAGFLGIVVAQPIATALGTRRANTVQLAVAPGWLGVSATW